MRRSLAALLLAELLALNGCSSTVKREGGTTNSGGTETSGAVTGASGDAAGGGSVASGSAGEAGAQSANSQGIGGTATAENVVGGTGTGGNSTGGDGTGGNSTDGIRMETGGNASGGDGTEGFAAGGSGGTSSSTDSAGGTGGTAAACETNEVCAPPTPQNWAGPVATVDDLEVSCPPDYPTLALDAGSNPTSSGACACNCPTPTGICDSSAIGRAFSNATCSGEPDSTSSITTSNCAHSSGWLEIVVAKPTSVTCGAGTAVDNLIPAEFEDEVRVCVGATGSGSCNVGGICVPEPAAPFAANVCVFRRGEHDCPRDYPTGALYYEELADTRDCPNTCTCNAQGGECSASFALLGECSIAGGGFGTASSTAPTCRQMGDTNANSARLGAAPVLASGSASCVPVTPSPSGQVAFNEPVTLCCL